MIGQYMWVPTDSEVKLVKIPHQKMPLTTRMIIMGTIGIALANIQNQLLISAAHQVCHLMLIAQQDCANAMIIDRQDTT